MAIGPRLDLRQTQSLVMTPQLQQAIKLLALSNVEIEAFIAEEVEKNPLLDGTRADEGAGPPAAEPPAEPAATDAQIAADTPADAALDADYAAHTFHHDAVSDRPAPSGAGGEDGVDFDSFASDAPSLHDHLTQQAGAALVGVDRAIAGQIIDAIDDAGYLTAPLRDIADRLGAPIVAVERVLGVVHGFDPTGVGARDLAECLRLQAIEADRYDPCMAMLLANLDLLAAGKLQALQRACDCDAEDLADMIREVRAYDPKPGLRYGATRIDAVVPDIFVRDTGRGGWRVEVNGATLPRLLVDRRYHAELAAGATRATKGWLSDCLQSANWLVKALDQRQRTIVKVATAIVAAQDGFFRHGVTALKPLTLRQIAERVDLHESTVSRVTSNKYLASPRGTFELKYFFSSAIASSDVGGEASSARAVKAAIKMLIDQEGETILSDDRIAELLRTQGFDCARRTVVKYREAMGIGSSVARRRARAIACAA